ncbi:MAG TPA: 2-iminoacetate synthase ThiH [Candidatus Hydrogenedentes bacterium]|nr:2-iminoacetate synthase ThiH [Candidatus Hydrogenedentota bacterium]
MSFLPMMEAWPRPRVEALYAGITPEEVDAALHRDRRSLRDLAVLLSPFARPRLEDMAHEAHQLTRRHFGRTVSLYAPLYISNLCAADCLYCGFAAHSGSREKRTTLSPEQIRRECEALQAMGYQSVLLLTGDAPRAVPLKYIADAVGIAREFFPSVAMEIYALDTDGYRTLCGRGLEGVTLYMETYDRETYARVHQGGDKVNYDFRLDAIARAGEAGARRLSIGALLGLCDWRIDVIWLAMHARWLQKQCWRSALSISFPRLRHTPPRFAIPCPVSDADLVQIMLGLRLFLPEVGFNLSTRETPAFRDKLIPLGITAMSAGSSTRPGGYATHRAGFTGHSRPGAPVLEQFEIDDRRSPAEVVAAIRRAGYDPVWKDFDRAYDNN